MRNILIPINFSETSLNAVGYAMEVFTDVACHFILLHIDVDGLDYRQKPVYRFGTNILVEKAPKTVNQKLSELKKSFLSASKNRERHRFTTVKEEGYFLETIRKYVLEKQIELIVMGTKGASELREFFTGSHTGDVITKVECDVLAVPKNAQFKGFAEIVFPVDFTLRYTDAILQGILNTVTPNNTHIRVLHITKTEKPLSPEGQAEKENLLHRLNESLPDTISFHRQINKNVERAILDFSKNLKADLIVMVSKDHSLFHRLFLDTTVEEVSFETDIPLLSLQG